MHLTSTPHSHIHPCTYREEEKRREVEEQQRLEEQKQREEEEYQRMKAEFAVVEAGTVEDDMAAEVRVCCCVDERH